MRDLRWVLQDNLGNAGDLDAMQRALDGLLVPWTALQVIPFDDAPPEVPCDGKVIFYGSTTLMRNVAREGRWRLNLTGAGQTAWLRGRHPALEDPKLNHLLACDELSWSATFDWGNDGLSHLGFELFPAGRLQQGSAWPDPAVDRLIAQVSPWLPTGALERSLERQVHWQHHHQPSHRIGFSHFKLMPTANSPNDWMLKLYLLSHATG